MNLITYFLKYMKIYLKDDVDQNLLSTILGFAAEFGYVYIVWEITHGGGHLHVVKYLMSLDPKYGMDPAAIESNQAHLSSTYFKTHVCFITLNELASRSQTYQLDLVSPYL